MELFLSEQSFLLSTLGGLASLIGLGILFVQRPKATAGGKAEGDEPLDADQTGGQVEKTEQEWRELLTPAQYRKLHEFDPLVEIAEMKGRADGEITAARTLYNAAAAGDAKAALDILTTRPAWGASVRVMRTGPSSRKDVDPKAYDLKRIVGGLLVQDRDLAVFGQEPRVVTERQPDEAAWRDLRFATVCAKHVRSVFQEGELSPRATVARLATVQQEGDREVTLFHAQGAAEETD